MVLQTTTQSNPEPTAEELATQCGELIQRRRELEKNLLEAKELLCSLEWALIDGGDIDKKRYRSARDAKGDLESRMQAIDRKIRLLKDQGSAVLSREISASQEGLNIERIRLKAAQGDAIQARLFPLLKEFYHLRECITGLPFWRDDARYLRNMVRFHFSDDDKRQIFVEMEKLRETEDMSNTLGSQLRQVEDGLKRIVNGNILSFDAMISRSQTAGTE